MGQECQKLQASALLPCILSGLWARTLKSGNSAGSGLPPVVAGPQWETGAYIFKWLNSSRHGHACSFVNRMSLAVFVL